MKIAIIVIVNLLTITHNFQISLSYPFLMSNAAVISYMNSDFDGNYFVQYSNGTLIKYNPSLTSSQIITYASKIQQMDFINYYYYFTLQNGTSLTAAGNYQFVIYNNWKSISFHDYSTYAILSSYDLNDTIITSCGQTFSYSSSYPANPHHVLVCKNSIQFIYQSQTYMVNNYSTTFGSDFTAVSAVFQPFSYGTSLNTITAAYIFYVSNSINQTYQFTLDIAFLFNTLTLNFDFSGFTAHSYNMIFTLNENIVNMQFDRLFQIVIMQSLPSQNYYFYLVLTGQLGTGVSNLTSFLMHQLFDDGINLYILSTTGLIQINAPTDNSTNLILLYVVSLLPPNNYELVFRNELLYIINEPNIYNAGLCIGQTSYISPTCTNYSCNTDNCSYCPFNAQTCGVCDSGFARNLSFLCAVQQNLTESQSLRSFFIQYLIDIRFLVQLFKAFLASLSTIIAVPGARAVITPIFYLFGNFDNLFLYQYHDSAYNYVLKDFFSQLNHLQTNKWNLINTTDVISRAGDLESFNNLTNFQQAYQKFNYTSNTLNVGQSEGLFYNSQNYFLGALPIIFVYFCVFHFLFRFLFRYSISKIFRKYQFWLFLFLIQFDGNVQQLTFYLSREWISIFSFTISQKLLKTAIIYYGFVLVFVSCAAYYFCRWFYKQKIKIVMENCKNNATGIFYITFQFGLRNIYFGAVNFYGRFLSYYTLVSILLVSETLIFLSILFFRTKLFKKMLEVWLFLILSLLRLMFIVSLIFDFSTINIQAEQCQFVLIVSMIVVFIIGIVIGLAGFMKSYVLFFYRKCSSNLNNKIVPSLVKLIYKNQLKNQKIKQILPKQIKPQIIMCQSLVRNQNKDKSDISNDSIISKGQKIFSRLRFKIRKIRIQLQKHTSTTK